MKLTSLFLALTSAAVLSASAADQPKDSSATTSTKPAVVEKSKTKPAKTDTKQRHGAVTGSLIPQGYRESGRITDLSSPLYVINSDAIARSGAANLSQALIHTGFHR